MYATIKKTHKDKKQMYDIRKNAQILETNVHQKKKRT